MARKQQPKPSAAPFRRALNDVLEDYDEYTTLSGTVNLSAFGRDMQEGHYETLRKMMAGSRKLAPWMLAEVSRVLGIRPDYFAEWRMLEAQKRFDPNEVGFDRALRNLDEWGSRNDG